MAKILVIDDESNIRMMLRLALEHVGHTVEQAADGFEGLEKFGEGADWSLVLLDYRMPGMEGTEVLKEIRKRNKITPVVMITAFGTVDLASEALREGATDFLRKPFTVEVLREAVDAALTGEPHLPHVATGAPLQSFERTGINGFRLLSLPGVERMPDGSIVKTFNVQRVAGIGHACRVVIPTSIVGQVNATNDQLWEALCGEALANYLWQNATVPPGGQLIVEELTRSLRRWLDAVAA
ncbi:MAG: response regulator [Armatimonas sp.]